MNWAWTSCRWPGTKIYAPKGIGALYIRKGIQPEIFCHGAGQETGRRAGTENVLEIVGLGKACELADRELTRNADHMRVMRDRFEEGLSQSLTDLRFNGHRDKRLPQHVQRIVPGGWRPMVFSKRSGWTWPPRPEPPAMRTLWKSPMC